MHLQLKHWSVIAQSNFFYKCLSTTKEKFSYPLVIRTRTILNLVVWNPRVLVQKASFELKTQKQSAIWFLSQMELEKTNETVVESCQDNRNI